jgi:hypothetical protein
MDWFLDGFARSTVFSRPSRSGNLPSRRSLPRPIDDRKSARLDSLDVFAAGDRRDDSRQRLAPGPRSTRRSITPIWNGWTMTDLVFPFLLFAMGAAVPFWRAGAAPGLVGRHRPPGAGVGARPGAERGGRRRRSSGRRSAFRNCCSASRSCFSHRLADRTRIAARQIAAVVAALVSAGRSLIAVQVSGPASDA